MARCWILLGMMGSGKSTVGKLVAEISGRQHLDTDSLLQRRLGRPISQLFAIYGEEAFREHETCVLRGLEPSECVISTGGGIVLREENWLEMKRLGTTAYLRVEPEVLRERLKHSKRRRPLLQVDDWERRLAELLESRRALYERADVQVDVSQLEHREAAERVIEAIVRFERKRGDAT